MGSLLPLSCHRHPPSLHSPTLQRHSHLFEVTDGVLRPVDVADHPAGQLVRGGVVVLGEGQQQRQEPDHSHHHLGLCGRHALLQRMDDGHVPAEEEWNGIWVPPFTLIFIAEQNFINTAGKPFKTSSSVTKAWKTSQISSAIVAERSTTDHLYGCCMIAMNYKFQKSLRLTSTFEWTCVGLFRKKSCTHRQRCDCSLNTDVISVLGGQSVKKSLICSRAT